MDKRVEKATVAAPVPEVGAGAPSSGEDASVAAASDAVAGAEAIEGEEGQYQFDGPSCPVTAGPEERERLDYKVQRARHHFLNVWTAVGAILLAAVVIFLVHVMALPASIIIWTTVIVFCLRGVVSGLEKRGLSRAVGTTLAYVLMFAVLALIGLLLFSPMFGLNSQFLDLIQSLPSYVQGVTDWLSSLYERYKMYLDDDTVQKILGEVQTSAANFASQIAQGSAQGIVGVGTALANTIMAIGFAMVIAFWVLLQLPAIGRETKLLIGPKHAEDAAFWHLTFTRVMGGYIKATIIQCAIIGAACAVVFLVLDIPNAAALGAITGIMNIIPIIGPWLGGAAAALVALFKSPLAAVLAVLAAVIIQQFVYTFVSPRLMQSSCDVHPAVTLLALMMGSALGGAMDGLMGSLVGMLASIPAAAVAKSFFVYYFEKRTGRRIVSEDGVLFKSGSEDMPGNMPRPLVDATGPSYSQKDYDRQAGKLGKFFARFAKKKQRHP